MSNFDAAQDIFSDTSYCDRTFVARMLPARIHRQLDLMMPASAEMPPMVEVPETLQRVTRLTPLDEVLARIDALARPVVPREVGVAAALGRVLAADVRVA